MKLYVIKDGKKVFINYKAVDRNILAALIGSTTFKIEETNYSVDDVYCEHGNDSELYPPIVICAFMGLMGGPIGLLVGGVIGIFIGYSKTVELSSKAVLFNSSVCTITFNNQSKTKE